MKKEKDYRLSVPATCNCSHKATLEGVDVDKHSMTQTRSVDRLAECKGHVIKKTNF